MVSIKIVYKIYQKIIIVYNWPSITSRKSNYPTDQSIELSWLTSLAHCGLSTSFVQLLRSLSQALYFLCCSCRHALPLQTKDSNFRQSHCPFECYTIFFRLPFPLFSLRQQPAEYSAVVGESLRTAERLCRANKFPALGVATAAVAKGCTLSTYIQHTGGCLHCVSAVSHN